jgi:hypothetical protein
MPELRKRGRPKKQIKIIELPVPPTYEKPTINGAKVYEPPRLKKIREEFTITFTSIPERVICPNCKKLQFTVNQGSTNASIVRVCQCGAKTTFKFEILPFGLSTSSPLT